MRRDIPFDLLKPDYLKSMDKHMIGCLGAARQYSAGCSTQYVGGGVHLAHLRSTTLAQDMISVMGEGFCFGYNTCSTMYSLPHKTYK